jgi:signal peptidase II
MPGGLLGSAVTELDARPEAAARRGEFLGAAAVVLVADQLTKAWAVAALDGGRIIDLVGSLRFRLTFNDGSAFGLGAGRTTLVAVIAVAVSLVVVRIGLRATSRPWAVGFGLVLGGALGNLVDRAVRDGDGFLGGRVVDFIDLQWWPVFNIADVAIVAGVGLLVLLSFRSEEM